MTTSTEQDADSAAAGAPGGKDDTAASRTLDAAVLLTIASAGLYVLGWTYWSSYFKYFGVDDQFITLSFRQILATTWIFLVFLLPAVGETVGFEILDKPKIDALSLAWRNVARLPLLAIIVVVAVMDTPWWAKVLAVLLAVLGSMLADRLRGKKPLPLTFLGLKRRSGRILAGVMLFFSCLALYSIVGEHHAARVAEGKQGARITIHMKTGWQPPAEAILVGQMGGRYFITSPAPQGKKAEVTVIQESEVARAVIKRDQ